MKWLYVAIFYRNKGLEQAKEVFPEKVKFKPSPEVRELLICAHRGQSISAESQEKHDVSKEEQGE